MINQSTLPKNLPGLDVEECLKRLQHNELLFSSLLISFADDFGNAAEKITLEIHAGRIKEAARIAHTIKSLAGTLCAENLGNIAREIESDLKNNQFDTDRLDILELHIEPIIEAAAIVKHKQSAPTYETDIETSQTESAKPYILIIDDNKLELDILTAALASEYNILCAENGAKGLKIAYEKSLEINLILLDMSMPEMNGLEVCRILKETMKNKHTPIIFVSATANVDDEKAGFEAGAVDYISKPISAPILKARVNNHIKLHSLKQSLEETIDNRTRTLSHALVELAKSSNVKDEFLSTVSHELRTPINGIFGSLELLKEKVPLDDALQTAMQSAENLKSMIENILLFSEAKSGKLVFDNRSSNAEKIAQQLSEKYKLICDLKGLEFNPSICTEVSPHFYGDEHKISITLDQVLDNAVKFTDFGKITFSVKIKQHPQTQTKVLDCLITDTGIGMPPDQAQSYLNHFQQADGSFRRRHGGLGIGLGVSHHIIKSMGGQMTLYADMPTGTCCHIVFPLNTSFDRGNKQDDRERNNNKHILVIEDNRINQLVIKRMVEKLGYTVSTADDGNKAIPLIQQNQYTCILMDCQMPIMDGFDTTRYIRKTPNVNQNIPIVAVTANAMSGDKERCLCAGMDDYISKPVKPELLKETLEKWVCPQAEQKNQIFTSQGEKLNAKPVILLVEDNKQSRDLLSVFIKRADVLLDTAQNGQEAIDKAIANNYSLILMDIEMPVMDGVEAFKVLKASHYPSPIYALTANDEEENIKAFIDLGFTGHLAKPVDIPHLLSVINKAIQNTP